MSKEHYYLISSLPSLRFKGNPPFSEEGFLEECRKWLSSREMEELMDVNGPGPGGENESPVTKRCKEFDRTLRNELAEYREAKKRGEDRKPGVLAGKILEQGNPLDSEMFLEKTRWDFFDSQAVGHFFDIGRLVVYRLQLAILARLAKFDKDKGETYFHEICEVKYDYAAR
jgi:hypothetical protein